MNKKMLFFAVGLWLGVNASQAAPVAEMTFKVVTDSGKPVEGATVGISTFSYWQPGSEFGKDVHKGTKGLTDTNGIVRLKYPSLRGGFSYRIKDLPDYYPDWGGDYAFKEIKDGKWQPWNPTIELVFKPIINPVPMYGKMVYGLAIPEIEKQIGYDLEKGDWVAPYGRGMTSDFVFNLVQRQFAAVTNAFDATMVLAFSNDDDGILSFSESSDRGSGFCSPRYAPEFGYEPQLTLRKFREARKPIVSSRKENQNYFFRMRTVKKDGRIVSALYGKVYGNINFDFFHSPTATLAFTYYLNPEPNSRNVEFDPKRNLMKGLKGTEQPNAP